MKKFPAVFLGVALLAMIIAIISVQKAELQEQESKFKKSERKIPGKYIVVLEDRAAGAKGIESNAQAVTSDLSIGYGGKVERVFQHAPN